MYWKQNAQALRQAQPQASGWLNELESIPAATEVQLLQTAAGDYSLSYRGIPLHSLNGAAQEAAQTAQAHCKPALGRAHLILGLGLGYVLEAAFQRSPGQIVVYEPDLPLLKFILENVDLSEYLGSGRVKLTTTTTETLSALQPYLASEDPLDILVIPGYAQLMHAEIPQLMDDLFRMVEDRVRDFKTGQHFHLQWTRQFFQNAPHFAQCSPFSTLAELYGGKPALIIGRGPSLDAALDDIAKLADSMTLIAAGSALHRLYAANITPDMAVFYDANAMSEQLYGLPSSYLEKIIFCVSPFTERVCFTAPSRSKVLTFPQSGEMFAQWLSATQPDLPAPLVVEGGGTVSLVAMQLALALESSHIVLIGQDLAFPSNQVYAGGIALKQDEQGRLALEKRDNLFTAPEAMTLVKGQGQDGQPLPALKAYASFIRHFEKLATENETQAQPIPFYNASLGGAAIQGYQLAPLSSFQNQFQQFKTETLHSASLASQRNDCHAAPEFQAEALRKTLSLLQQNLNEAIRLHEATLPEHQPASPAANQTLFNFLNQHPLISHILMFEMMGVQRRYNPNARTPAEIENNQTLLRQSTLACIELLRNQILPLVIQAQSQFIAQAQHATTGQTAS